MSEEEQQKTEQLGGWVPIPNINDPHVKEIADFAVKEYNMEKQANLKLEGIIKGEKQIVDGVNYGLTLATKDEKGTNKKNKAVVWEKTLEKLSSFTEV
uniref:Cystatin domain-containing protein n=1 Tax=Quercus lobata TaxID=97700 RepID=A0A7N2LIX1_QUELO